MATQTYTVRQGDTLSGIAKKYGVRSSDITGYKSNDPNRIGIGETLQIRTGGASTSPAVYSPAGTVMTTSDFERANGLPEPTQFISANTKGSSFNDIVSGVAQTTFKDNKLTLDNARALQIEETKLKREKEQSKNDRLQKEVAGIVGSTTARDAVEDIYRDFDVNDNVRRLRETNEKIVQAQQALEMGLIYEGDRPARMRLINGRSASLQKQGLATIGALQGTAAVLQGNINLAMSYAENTVAAINMDNNRSLEALRTLLNLSNNELVTLKTEEREQVEGRIQTIQDEMDKLDKDKDQLTKLMLEYPKAFQDGGVSLLDTYEEAIEKMVPSLARDERMKFEASLRSGSSAGKVDKDAIASSFKAQLLQLKANGGSKDEAILAFGDVLPIDYINDVWGGKMNAADAITNQYYNQFLNPDGTVKKGVNISIDPKNGRPIVTDPANKKSDGNWVTNTAKKGWGFVKGLF